MLHFIKKEDAFSVGSWFTIEYGFQNKMFYILETKEDKCKICPKEWLVSCGFWMDKEEMLNRNFNHLGKGELKWYWNLLPWKDCIVPFTNPK